MRRLPALLVPVLGLLIAAAPAYASHTHVGSSVRVLHGSNDVATYLSQEPVTGNTLIACSGTLCETPVPMNGRDYGRFVRWCGDATQPVTIPAGSSSAVVVCQGPSTWTLRVGAALNDCSGTNCVAATHSADVVVDVVAVRQ